MRCYQLDTAISSFVTGNTPNFMVKMKFFCCQKASPGPAVLTWGLQLNLRKCKQPEIIHKAGHPATVQIYWERATVFETFLEGL